ncbi:MAG: SusC/RagA family TonB-linked outer membrane protein [Chitinophagaceae bacterium]|nr:SusC/RagA family TonB-linked outer membrane protein [Chitinophagaceae bacterium]
MRKFFRFMLMLMAIGVWIPLASKAQETTVTGTVISEETKAPLSGVTVRVKGTRRIVQTDASGKFSIKVNPGEILQFTFVGYQTEEVKPSGGNLGITLKIADTSMDEVVVTAMDIKRNPRSMGYAVQTLKGEEIQETQRENFVNSLQGRVAGLTLDQTSGLAGASSAIVLRGFNSLSLSNQPLFVVDGIILDNQTINETSSGGQGIGLASDRPNRVNDYQNRIADLNPNDIETITVLKGPEATALYGSQASSGAIVITTKKPKTNKLSIQYDNSFRIQRVVRWPETIDLYNTGVNGINSNTFSYFGEPYAPGTQLFDNKNSFFRTGKAQTHNLGVDFGIKKSVFRISASLFDQQGVVPNNDFKRYNARITNTTKLWKDRIEITPSFAYTRSFNNKVLRSAGSYLLSLLIWPSTNDIRNYEDLTTGDKLDLFANVAANAEYDNPLFNVKKNRSYDETERMIYTLGINFSPVKSLTFSGRFGYDTYNTEGYMFFHPQSFFVSAATGGSLDNYWRKYFGYNHTITATFRKNIAKDLNLKIMAGTMWQDYETRMFAVYGTNIVDNIDAAGKMIKNGQVITDKDLKALVGNYMDSNVTRPNTRLRLLRNAFGEYNKNILRQFATFGEIALSFKNLAFLSYTHRFETASTLPAQNRNYDYPGGSLSIIMSDLAPGLKKGGKLNYWKLRTSLAGTARLNTPYSTQSVFVNNFASGGGYSYGFFNNSPDLRPERQSTYELGSEMRLFKNRLSFDVTYYNTLNKDQIVQNFRLSYGTGFVLNTQNVASTRNQGIEIVFDYEMIRNKALNWNMRFNFNKMYNKVVNLPDNVAEYYIADTWLYGNARGGLVKGGPTTSITATDYLRNNAGQIIINPLNGLPLTTGGVFQVVGDRNPDFTLGWLNNIRWKSFRISVLWDLKVGGDIYNGTNRFLTIVGRSKLTADRYTPRVIQGVLNDGNQNSATPTINTIAVIPAYNNQYYTTMPEAAFVERDVNWFRLRDITISYSFPKKMIKSLKNLSVFITGNDLILLTNYSGADPAVNGNTAGTPGVGAFGFDYATLPSPLQLNFGLRASF